ncbi:hypothetical protein PCE1_004264 [Barthelona sp. PCE]
MGDAENNTETDRINQPVDKKPEYSNRFLRSKIRNLKRLLRREGIDEEVKLLKQQELENFERIFEQQRAVNISVNSSTKTTEPKEISEVGEEKVKVEKMKVKKRKVKKKKSKQGTNFDLELRLLDSHVDKPTFEYDPFFNERETDPENDKYYQEIQNRLVKQAIDIVIRETDFDNKNYYGRERGSSREELLQIQQEHQDQQPIRKRRGHRSQR